MNYVVMINDSNTKLSLISKLMCMRERSRDTRVMYGQVYTKNSVETGSLNKVTGRS